MPLPNPPSPPPAQGNAGASNGVLFAREEVGQTFFNCRFLRSSAWHLVTTFALGYNFYNSVSIVVLYSIVFGYLDSLLALEILVFTTCGEFLSLLKNEHERNSSRQLDRQSMFALAALSFVKLLVVCALFFVDRSELISLGGFVTISVLIICGFQGALYQIFHIVAQTWEHDYSAAWREERDLERPLLDVGVESGVRDLRLGRQYLRKGSFAELPSGFDFRSYTLVRLTKLGKHKFEEISVKLDNVGRLHEVSSVLELPDQSWEMVVLKSYLPELEITLGEIFPGCHLDPIYNPTEPGREDVERLHAAAKDSKSLAKSGGAAEDAKRFYVAAKILKIDAFASRAMAMIREEGSWPVAAAYYSCLLERNMTWLEENTA